MQESNIFGKALHFISFPLELVAGTELLTSLSRVAK